MKLFKKVLILKWHYIEHEYIDLGKINFLTGKNASGKSTIIDAIQLVLLGDTKGNFFNKAANEKSHRTLSSYVKGELTDNIDGYDYLRNDDFSSIIALEIYDTAKRNSFTIGIHLDVFNDGSLNHKYFILNDKILRNHFIENDLVMSIQELKAHCQSEKIRIEQFSTNKRYQESLLAKLGHVNQKFFSLFKKAVPFSPITNIKGFITEFICDTDKKVEIKDMQDNIRYYEKMKLEAEDMESRILHLDKISTSYLEFLKLEKLEKIQSFIHIKGREEIAKSKVEKLTQTLKSNRKQLGDIDDEIVKGEEKIGSMSDEINLLNRQLHTSDAFERKEQFKKKIEVLKDKITQIERDKENIFNKLKFRLGKWQYIHADVCENIDFKTPILQAFKDEDVLKIEIEKVKELELHMEKNLQKWQRDQYQNSMLLEELGERKNAVSKEAEQLQKGNKVIPKGVMKLKKALNDSMGEVSMLCDLIELKSNTWQNAIEGYLHLQKFYLVVPIDRYDEALEIYEKIKNKENIYDVGLIDLKKAKENYRKPLDGSLALEVVTKNEYVRCYIDYLLGNVIKVYDVKDLRKHKTSITASCMLYKNFVARNLNPKRYEVPFIGKDAVKKQLELKELELKEIVKEEEVKKSYEIRLEKLTSLKTLGEDVIEQLENKFVDFKRLPDFIEQKVHLIKEMEEIDMSGVIELQLKIQDMESGKKKNERNLVDLKADKKTLIATINRVNDEELPNSNKIYEMIKEAIENEFEFSFIESVGMNRYEEEKKRLNSPSEIVRNFETALKRTENKKQNKWNEVIVARSDYTRIFRATYDINTYSNETYDKLNERLKSTELPKYKEKIDESIKMAQQEFKDDFLSKLKYNIDVVKSQIEELNEALKYMSFGKDEYSFKVTPNSYYKKYYNMIMDPDLMSDFNIFSFSFQEKYGEIIDELFKKIIDVGEGAISADERAEIEENIAKYTDYRTYLDFDLVVEDMNGNKSHLSKMINKKSGGETQTPFYISVLASFYRVYRMNTKSDDTIRMIVFDEAFSKMDNERIEQCVILLKELGFQALISAPSEKIANIAPLVDKTLCVFRTLNTTVVKGFTKEELLNG